MATGSTATFRATVTTSISRQLRPLFPTVWFLPSRTLRPNEKDQFITWVGGYSLAIPRGAHNVDDAWTFIKFATSLKGWQVYDQTQRTWDRHLGRTFIPHQVANREANEWQFTAMAPADPRFAGW